MHKLTERLAVEKPVLTDGAWGTELQNRGLGVGECPDLWNLEHPDRVAELAQSYVEAGSRVILTNTFRANRIALAPTGQAQHTKEINRAGVEISLQAAKGRALVFAAIGPSGKLLCSDEVTKEELQEAFSEQVRAAAAAGADGIVVETMSDLDEASLAVMAARETGLPVVACMTFDSGKNRTQTIMGTTLKEAAETLTAAGADVIGANCGQGIDHYLELYTGLCSATDRPIWLKPNAGSPELDDCRTVYKTTPEEFARAASSLVQAGAKFIGGCCGTTPAFIRALHEMLAASSGKVPCA